MNTGGAPAPQWLASAFVRSARTLGATADPSELKATAERLIERWQESNRFHHGLPHLIEVLQRVDTLAEEAHNPDAVRLAAWYHGAIFDTSMMTEYRRAAGEDKDKSAALAAGELAALGVPEQTIEQICEMILKLKGHAQQCSDIDCQVLSDADLGSLAVEPQKYRKYRENVRKEFSHLEIVDYLDARITIITKLLGRTHLFASPMAKMWEDAARENLAAELARLKAERECLETKPAEECEPGAHEHAIPAKVAEGQVPKPPTLETEPEPKPRLAGEKPAAEVVGRPVGEEPRTEKPAAETPTSWGIEREPSDLRSLPRRNAKTVRMERRTELEVEDPDRDPPRPSGERPTRPKDDDATGSLFKPLQID